MSSVNDGRPRSCPTCGEAGVTAGVDPVCEECGRPLSPVNVWRPEVHREAPSSSVAVDLTGPTICGHGDLEAFLAEHAAMAMRSLLSMGSRPLVKPSGVYMVTVSLRKVGEIPAAPTYIPIRNEIVPPGWGLDSPRRPRE